MAGGKFARIWFVGAVFSVALLGACGGGDDSDDGTIVDPGKADELARKVLLTDKDLPGIGWTVTQTDQFSDAESTVDTAACKEINAKRSEARAKSDAARAGRAEQALTLDSKDAAIPATVDTEINIFKDATAPAESLKLYQSAVQSANFEQCLKDGVAAAAGQGSTIYVQSVKPLATAPEGGTGLAYDFNFDVEGETYKLHYETYLWRFANVGVTVTVSGGITAVTKAMAEAAVEETQSKVKGLPRK
ncbi:MAG: hypothetical protein HYX53_00330 [Chloroflexi bacterium]|nr:hypothetical protein [Chloroflexota bacterium]